MALPDEKKAKRDFPAGFGEDGGGFCSLPLADMDVAEGLGQVPSWPAEAGREGLENQAARPRGLRCWMATAEVEGSPVGSPVRVGMGASSSSSPAVSSSFARSSHCSHTVLTGEMAWSHCRVVGL